MSTKKYGKTALLSRNLKKVLKARGIKQADLARQINVTPGHLSDVLRRGAPGARLLALIAARLEIPAAALLKGEIDQEGAIYLSPSETLAAKIKDEVNSLLDKVKDDEEQLQGILETVRGCARLAHARNDPGGGERKRKASSTEPSPPESYELKS